MIIRALVVPHPPLLVPELVTGAAQDTEPVRSATVAAATELAAIAPNWVAVAADPSGPRTIDSPARGSFAGFGADVRVRLDATAADGAGPADPSLPLPALVAGWLRDRAGAARVIVHLVPPDLSTGDCRATGASLAASLADTADPVGLLVLGDGSNRHTDRAPARPDDRATAFDDAVRTALAAADPHALLDLDPHLAAELGAAGRAAWQVLAGVALAVGGGWRGDVRYSDFPFGVAYHVADWTPPGRGAS